MKRSCGCLANSSYCFKFETTTHLTGFGLSGSVFELKSSNFTICTLNLRIFL